MEAPLGFIRPTQVAGLLRMPAVPFPWNNLPAALREIESLGVFKRKLKSHIFKAAL